jgi:hypothetical protein
MNTGVIAISTATEQTLNTGLTIASIQESDVASMAEIASCSNLSRVVINNYSKATRGPGDFPEPVFGLATGPPQYSWPVVASWLHLQRKVSANLVAESQAAQPLTPYIAKATHL